MNRSDRRLSAPHVRTRRLVDPTNAGGGLNAHRRVAAVAVEMANHLFEEYMRVNAIYHQMRAAGQVTEKAARKLFVERVAPRMLEDARRALTDMLTQPDDRVPPSMKEEIAEALMLDNDLRGKRIIAEDVAAVSQMIH